MFATRNRTRYIETVGADLSRHRNHSHGLLRSIQNNPPACLDHSGQWEPSAALCRLLGTRHDCILLSWLPAIHAHEFGHGTVNRGVASLQLDLGLRARFELSKQLHQALWCGDRSGQIFTQAVAYP